MWTESESVNRGLGGWKAGQQGLPVMSKRTPHTQTFSLFKKKNCFTWALPEEKHADLSPLPHYRLVRFPLTLTWERRKDAIRRLTRSNDKLSHLHFGSLFCFALGSSKVPFTSVLTRRVTEYDYIMWKEQISTEMNTRCTIVFGFLLLFFLPFIVSHYR